MKKLLLPTLLITSSIFCFEAKAENIFEALSQAYNTNPEIKAQRAYLRSVDENVAIAKSGFRPTIVASAGYADTRNNDKLNNSNEGAEGNYLQAEITQPIFSGLSTVNSVKSADSLVRSEIYNLYDFEQAIFMEASEAYLNVVRDEALVNLQKNNEKLLKKQLDETQERFNVGDLTRTDVAQSKASYSSSKADRIAAEGDLEVSKAVYLQVVGVEPVNLRDPENIHTFIPANFNQALKATVENNYAVLKSKKMLESKEYDVKANYGALMPSVNAFALASKNKSDPNWYLDNNNTVDSVEFGVSLNVPLYSAGKDRAQIRQSKHAKWQAFENVITAERAAVAAITGYWESMVSNDAQIKALVDKVEANKIALDGVKKEEMLGNRTILDVLNAYQTLLDSEVEVVKAKRAYYLSAMNVMQAMGKLTAESLELNVELYQPKKYYKETRDKWLSTSVENN